MSLVIRAATPVAEEANTLSWGKRLFPMLLIQGYLWLSLALYAFGPWHWPMRDPAQFYTFVISCHVALFGGYALVAHRRPRELSLAWTPSKLVIVALLISLAVLPLTSYAKTGKVVPDILGSIANPGQAYMEAHLYAQHNTNVGAYLRILASPVLVMLFPLVTFYWSRLGKVVKWSAVSIALAIILLSVATGQRRDIADLIVTLPLIAIASCWAGVNRISRRTQLLLATAFLGLIAAFLAYFAYSHISRVGADTASYAVNPATRMEPDRDNVILEAVPESLHPGFMAFANYLTTGYYGLSLSMDRPHQPMYGFGHSMFLTRNYERFANDENFEHRSLAVQISDKDGFKYPVYWCTAYPYFANDLGFAGTVLLMFAFGAMLALTWIDMIGGRNPASIVFFWLLAILIFYLPATNRMLQDGEGVVAFYTWLVIYLYHRKPLRRGTLA